MSESMIISDRIFQILKSKGMSQKTFSQKTGIPQSTISDWKHKRVNPGADKIMIICDTLGVTPQELLTGAGNDNKFAVDYVVLRADSEEYAVVKMIRGLSERSRERLKGYVEALQSE